MPNIRKGNIIDAKTNIIYNNNSWDMIKCEDPITGEEITLQEYLKKISMAPSNKYKDYELGPSGSQYVAPANGWFAIAKRSLKVGENLSVYSSSMLLEEHYGSVNGEQGLKFFIPVIKGQTITIRYSAMGVLERFCFIYALGWDPDDE